MRGNEGESEGEGQGTDDLRRWEGPAILLVDLDAFFASVEQLDHPGWRGKPVIVGGDPARRGVVSTASYEARRFGVHSAMPSSQAARLCPDAIWSRGRFGRYREVSDQVMAILRDETPHVQQVSIDEAFLDVTPTRVNREHPVAVARRIQERVAALGVTCSVGVGATKAIAKIASDRDKPRGLTVVYPGSERGFLDPLPVRTLSGIGASSEAKLAKLGIRTLGDLARADDALVEGVLGKNGAVMIARARGVEALDMPAREKAKSVSNETSFAQDISSEHDVGAALATLSSKVARRLRKKGLSGSTVTVKVRYSNLKARTAQAVLDRPTDDGYAIRAEARRLIAKLWEPGVALRLVGVGVSGFEGSGAAAYQPSLFEGEGADVAGDAADDNPAADSARAQKLRSLQRATDGVRDRFGEGALVYGHDMRVAQNTTGSSAKNPADYK